MKRIVGAILALAVLAAAGGWAYSRWDARKYELPVLMYHHIVEDGQECNSMTVTEGRMAEDLQWLADHGYTTVLPRELAQPEFELPDKPVLITFDDGYVSNYQRLYPLLQQYQMKAVISIIVCMPDQYVSKFLSWDMCREMAASGLVEIGSHAWDLHNLDIDGASRPDGINGVQRRPEETDEGFEERVLADIRKSSERVEAEVGEKPACFAYPFGASEPDAEALIHELFPVTLLTVPETADLRDGLWDLPRYTVTMDKPLSAILRP